MARKSNARPAGKSSTATRTASRSAGTASAPKPVQATQTDASKVPAEVADEAAKQAAAAAGTEGSAEEAPPKPPEPKCSWARVQKGRPHPNLLRIITRKGAHPGKGDRIKRWERYEVGMSVLHCRVTEGLDHLDIGYYESHNGTDGKPLMSLRPMNEAEMAKALERWEGKAVDAQAAVSGMGAANAESGSAQAAA